VFQSYALLSDHTVRENITVLGMESRRVAEKAQQDEAGGAGQALLQIGEDCLKSAGALLGGQ